MPFSDPQTPLIGNVSAQPLTKASEIQKDLKAQLNSRVRWLETIQYMIQDGINIFFELGNNTVLTGLLKRIDREAQGFPLGVPDDFSKIRLS